MAAKSYSKAELNLYTIYTMTATDINKILNPIDVSTLLKETSIVWVHDTEANITYKANVKMLAKAIAKQLAEDGVIPIQGD